MAKKPGKKRTPEIKKRGQAHPTSTNARSASEGDPLVSPRSWGTTQTGSKAT